MLFSSSNITHIRRFLFIEAVRCLYIADFDLRCKFPSEKMSPVLVLHHYPHIKLPGRYFLWFHEDPWPWASRPCLRGSVGDNYYVSCMQICSAPGSTLTSTIIVSESLWVEAYLNISLLPVSNRLRGSEGDNYKNTHISRSAPTPMRLHAPTPWAGIGSLSNPLSATESDAGGFWPISAIYLAGYFIGRNNFLHNRFPSTNTTTHRERF